MNIRLALALVVLSMVAAIPAAAQSSRTLSLVNGDTLTPASPVVDATGTTTYYGALVFGQVVGTTPGTFTLGFSFAASGVIDETTGVYEGTILAPSASFSVTQASGRKSVSTSGTIDVGTVTYRLDADGRAEILGVVHGQLTIWEGKNSRRRAVGFGTLDYPSLAEGPGTIVLNYY